MRLLSYPISLIYGIIISFRNFLFDTNILNSLEYNVPIICVGNLTVGGTGKTPHIEYLLKLLHNKKSCVLTRGYGRETDNLMCVKNTSSSLDVGDEAIQIKQKFPECQIIVSGDRRKGIEYIIKEFPETEIILMDDGFQHRKIKAGLNIIINDYNNPFYYDKIMPLGTLRDHLNSIKRAEIVITSKCSSNLNPTEKKGIIKSLNLYPSQNAFFSEIKYEKMRSIFTNEEVNIPNKLNITLITSIANANPLIKFLKIEGNFVNHIKFADHHNYNQKDIADILTKFKTSNSTKNIILTTEKDKVKLQKFKNEFMGINCYFLPIKMIIHDQEKFNTQIIDYVTKHTRNS